MQHRKTKSFSVLFFCFGVFISGFGVAEAFDPVTPGEALAKEVPFGSATSTQYLALQEQAAESLASRESFQVMLEEQFDFSGAHGELREGRLLTNWEKIGLAAGVSGALAFAAYGLWRRRRREEMFLLREADEAALENLFQKSSDATNWQEKAPKQGLFGAGSILASLFALWQNKKARKPLEHPFPEMGDLPENFEDFETQAMHFFADPEQEIIQQKISALQPLPAAPLPPIKPEKSKSAQEYEFFGGKIAGNQNQQKSAQESLRAIESKLKSIWSQAEYYQSHADKNRYRWWTYYYTHPTKMAQARRRWYWQEYTDTRERVSGLEAERETLQKALPELESQQKLREAGYQEYQNKISDYKTAYHVYKQKLAEHNEQIARREQEIQSIKDEAAEQKQAWWKIAENYWKYQENIQTQEQQIRSLKIQMPGVIQKALAARENKRKQVFFTELRSSLSHPDPDADPTRAEQFLTQLLPASSQSLQLQAEAERVRNIHVYQTELVGLRAKLREQAPHQEKLEEVLENLATRNAYTRQELGEKYRHLKNAHWTVWEEWDNNRQNMGRIGDLFWNRRYTRYKFSLAKSREGYDPEKERILLDLAQKAKQEEWNSYKGWEKHFRVHPLHWKKKVAIWKYQKQHLQNMNDEHKKMLQTRISELEKLVSKNMTPLWAAKTWLEQTPEERLKNNYTQQLTKAELEGIENPALERDAVLFAQQEAEEKLNTSQAEILELIKNYQPEAWTAEAAVAQAVRTMKYYSSPEGIRHKNMVYSMPGDGNTFPIDKPVLGSSSRNSEQIKEALVKIKPEEVEKTGVLKDFFTPPKITKNVLQENISAGGVGSKKITVLIKLPIGTEVDWRARMGLAGHTGIALGNEFYDFGPQSGQGANLWGAQGNQWWDQQFGGADGDATLEEVIQGITEHRNHQRENHRIVKDLYRIEVEVSDHQFQQVKNYWEDLYENLGKYTFYHKQCTTTVAESLKRAGVIEDMMPMQQLLPQKFLEFLQEKLKNTAGQNAGESAMIEQIY